MTVDKEAPFNKGKCSSDEASMNEKKDSSDEKPPETKKKNKAIQKLQNDNDGLIVQRHQLSQVAEIRKKRLELKKSVQLPTTVDQDEKKDCSDDKPPETKKDEKKDCSADKPPETKKDEKKDCSDDKPPETKKKNKAMMKLQNDDEGFAVEKNETLDSKNDTEPETKQKNEAMKKIYPDMIIGHQLSQCAANRMKLKGGWEQKSLQPLRAEDQIEREDNNDDKVPKTKTKAGTMVLPDPEEYSPEFEMHQSFDPAANQKAFKAYQRATAGGQRVQTSKACTII